MSGATLGIDVGGTKIAAGVVDAQGVILQRLQRQTPANDPQYVFEQIIGSIKELWTSHDIEAVGIGAAGWIDVTRSTVMFAPNLAWRNEPLRRTVAEAVGLPVIVENDGNAAAWAEFVHGAGKDATTSMVLVTIGTGIGGGVILGGEVHRGAHGVAGEVGHTMAMVDGLPCRCGRRGCYEMYASGTALVRYARETAIRDPHKASALLALAGGAPEGIDGPMVTAAARTGDVASIEAFEEVGRWLGALLADLVQTLDPELLVIGGGVVHAGELLLAPTRQAYDEALSHRGRMPVAALLPAQLGNTAGLIGAADLARRR